MEDEGAVDRVLAGEVSAFSHIVQRWQGPLVNLAYRFCRDRSRAEDMAQEAFLRAYRALPKWRRESAFSTWLFALAINHYRSEIRRRPPPTESWQDTHEMGDQAGPESIAADEERTSQLRRAVQSLPERYRTAVTLFYFHEMDISKAASSLGLPQGTLKAQLSRARSLLRQKLQWDRAPSKPGVSNAS